MKRFPTTLRRLALATTVWALACASAGSRAVALERAELVVLGTTDVHGRLLPWDYYTGREADYGLARVATLVDSIRAAEPNALLLDSGDVLQGNPFTYYYGIVAPGDVHPVVRAMNLLRYDAAAVGNHEFNYGIEALSRALDGADFPFLAGNVFVAGTDSLAFPAWTLLERGGVRVAVLGFTTPGSVIWDRRNVQGRLEFRDIVESARRAWPQAEAASDVQIAIVHSGMGPTSSYDEAATGVPPENAGRALAEALPGLELVLLGHTHVEIPAERVNGVLLAQAGKWAEALAVARIALEREDGRWRVVDTRATVLPTAGVPPQQDFVAALRPYHERVLAYVADTIGWAPEPWSAASARLVDTPIIDLIQRVQLETTGAELSAASAFTTEARLGPGPITRAEAAGLYVYENTLKAIRITGRQLRDYLEYSAKYFHRVTPEGRLAEAADQDLFVDSIQGYNYDIVEGVEYAIDLTRPVGERIVGLRYRGEPVRDDQTFTMAINSYRQNGGGGYAMIQRAPVVYDRNEEIRELIIQWISERDTLRPADVFVPSWRLLPEGAVGRAVAEAQAAADTARLAAIAERERRRILGEAGSRVETGNRVRMAFLATNDIHGALLPTTPSWAHGDTVGGAAVLVAYIRAVEARYPGAAVWLDGGDVMQGTVISNLTRGRSTIEVLGSAGLDAAAIGNHEFDWSVDTLRARIEEAPFPWLSANIFEKATGQRPTWARPYAWIERAGLRIAVIGVSTVSTPWTTMPVNVEPFEFRDIATVVNELAPRLKAEGADLIVVVAHAGAVADTTGAYHGEIVAAARRITSPVDLIVSGHTHTLVETVENGIPIVQARSNGTALGVVVLTYDRAARKVVDHSIEVVTTYAKNVAPDTAVAAIVERYGKAVREIAQRPIAILAQTLERGPRGEEWALGDLIADAQRAATETQIAIVNPGGVRRDLAAGRVTYEDVFAVQPFQNVLIRMDLTAEQLRRLLEAAVENRIGQLSGIRISFDPTLPSGRRVREATLEKGNEPVVRDGKPVDPQAIYTVTLNNFMAAGGDTYAVLKDAVSATNTGLVDSDILANYLAGLPQPIRYQARGRITRLGPWPEPGE